MSCQEGDSRGSSRRCPRPCQSRSSRVPPAWRHPRTPPPHAAPCFPSAQSDGWLVSRQWTSPHSKECQARANLLERRNASEGRTPHLCLSPCSEQGSTSHLVPKRSFDTNRERIFTNWRVSLLKYRLNNAATKALSRLWARVHFRRTSNRSPLAADSFCRRAQRSHNVRSFVYKAAADDETTFRRLRAARLAAWVDHDDASAVVVQQNNVATAAARTMRFERGDTARRGGALHSSSSSSRPVSSVPCLLLRPRPSSSRATTTSHLRSELLASLCEPEQAQRPACMQHHHPTPR